MTGNLLHAHGRGSADRLGPKLRYMTQVSLIYFTSLIQWAKAHRSISCLLALLEIFKANKWIFIRFGLAPHIKVQEEKAKNIVYFGIEFYHITLAVKKRMKLKSLTGETKSSQHQIIWPEQWVGVEYAFSIFNNKIF